MLTLLDAWYMAGQPNLLQENPPVSAQQIRDRTKMGPKNWLLWKYIITKRTKLGMK